MDSVQVEIGPSALKYFEEIDAEYPGFSASLLSEFKRYKQSTKDRIDSGYSKKQYLPSIFGKDVGYTEPHGCLIEEIMHIHLAIPPNEFPPKKPQYLRVCDIKHPELDAALVYTSGIDDREYCFLILGIFYPHAHKKANNMTIMRKFIREARDFRERE